MNILTLILDITSSNDNPIAVSDPLEDLSTLIGFIFLYLLIALLIFIYRTIKMSIMEKEIQKLKEQVKKINKIETKEIDTKLYCKYCGNEIDKDSIFCKYCGKEFQKNQD